MRQTASIFKNWRADVFLLLSALSMLLMFCEADNVVDLIVAKAAGVVLGIMAFLWFRYWDAKGMMEEMYDNE